VTARPASVIVVGGGPAGAATAFYLARAGVSVTVLDPLGARQTYQRSAVNVTVEDPLAAHFDQLGKYTDDDMHNVYAYLETLK